MNKTSFPSPSNKLMASGVRIWIYDQKTSIMMGILKINSSYPHDLNEKIIAMPY